MSLNYKDTFLEDLEKKHSFIIGFPLYLLYKLYSSAYSIRSDTYSYCHHTIEGEQKHDKVLRHICNTIQMILPSVESTIGTENLSDVSRCYEYFIYWLQDDIKDENIPTENIEKLYSAIDYYMVTYNLNYRFSDAKNFNINKQEFHKIKKLHFYSEILYWIEKKNNMFLKSRENLYTSYLNDCSKYYDEIIREEDCKIIAQYKYELENFEKQFDKTKQFLLHNIPGISIEALKTHNKKTCPPDEPHDNARAKDVNVPDESLQSYSSSGPANTETTGEDFSNMHKNVSAGVIPGIIIGMPLLFFFAYKFTPFGIWVKSRLRGTTKRINNEEVENDLILLDRSDDADNYKENIRYTVHYHSSQNT
ncbi:PIR Superfamily Protein [Plasmodium ovale wallikeri]|uniref:PIR Superfamily Protein n=1 Tax=Plasmodium ovale wallikeri TaxID=864142 RepID=A0A1A9AG48_PLAOA|nr:PIR Superfamily Protein [Plasmodium ovale wallikeri]SBT56294.1 PIR Superfamily Protein [Plasmodium ovale wallikeri]